MNSGNILIPTPIPMSFLALGYQRGGIYEGPGSRGISHLMEHLVCKTFDPHQTRLRSLGVNYNAYTSDNRVVFWWEGLSECVEQIAQNVVDCVCLKHNLWSSAAFEAEKKVVLEEYGDCFNSQEEGVGLNAGRRYYNYFDPIGLREDIEAFTYEDSLRESEFYDRPDLLLQVGLSGVELPYGLRPQEEISNRLHFEDRGDYLQEDFPRGDKSIVGLLSSKPIAEPIYSRLSLGMKCLNGGLESPFYTEIREKRGLSYYSRGGFSILGTEILSSFYACTSEARTQELQEVYQDLLSKRFEDLVTEERFSACLDGTKISRRKGQILPHVGVQATILAEQDPFEDLDSFTFEEIASIANSHIMGIDRYVPLFG
jgi:predicted Zn-dependent peptidase